MGKKVKAAVLVGVERLEIKEFDFPKVGDEDGLLKIELAGVCGTDPKMYLGKVGRSLRADFPIIMGHEILGRIEDIGEKASKKWKVKKGDRVVLDAIIKCGYCNSCLKGEIKFCEELKAYGGFVSANVLPHLWGAYGEYMYLAPGSVVYQISEDISAEAAILINAVIADGIQWLRIMGRVSVGDSVVIQGIGQQGFAGIIAAKESGASPIIVTGLSRDEPRFPMAKEFGADYTINVEKEDAIKKVMEITHGRMADVVLDVTGSPKAIEMSVELVRNQGTVISAGVTGEEKTSLYIDRIVLKEIRFQGVFASSWKAITAAIRLVESKKYPVERIVSHKYPLEKAEEAIKAAGGMLGGVYPTKVVIVP